jgi:O-antigen ligase
MLLSLMFTSFYIYNNDSLRIQKESQGRYYIWLAGVNMLKTNPILGIGPGKFYSELESYYPANIRPWTKHEHGHSLFVQNFAEFGLLGGLLISFIFFYLFFLFFKKFRNRGIEEFAVFGAILAVLIHSFLDYTLLSPILNAFFWIIIGYAYNLIGDNS